MSSTKLVHLTFFVGGLLLGWLVLTPTVDWIWAAFDPHPPDLWTHALGLTVAGVGTYAAWRNQRVFGLANEVAVEVTKVTWPTRQETKWATIVVLITVAVAAVFLALFDTFWSWSTSKVYG